MSGTIALSGKRRALTIAWSRSPRRVELHDTEETQVGMPATVSTVTPPPMTNTERARLAGQASAAAKTPDERAEAARKAARGAHGLVATARKFADRWADADDDERREARRVLREAGVIR